MPQHHSIRNAPPKIPELPEDIWSEILTSTRARFPMWDKLSAKVVRHGQNDAATKIQAGLRCCLSRGLIKALKSFFPVRYPSMFPQLLGPDGYCYSKNTTLLMVIFPGSNGPYYWPRKEWTVFIQNGYAYVVPGIVDPNNF